MLEEPTLLSVASGQWLRSIPTGLAAKAAVVKLRESG